MGDGVSMEKIRNLSLKKTMVLYTILSLIVTFFLSVSIIEIAGQIQEEVWWKYVDQDEYYQAMNDRNENFEVVVPRPNQSKMSRMDWHISETCDFLQTYGVLLFSFADVFNHMIYKGEKFSVGSCQCNGGDDWNEDRKKRRGRNGECL